MRFEQTEMAWTAGTLFVAWMLLHEVHRNMLLISMCQFVMNLTKWAADMEKHLKNKLAKAMKELDEN